MQDIRSRRDTADSAAHGGDERPWAGRAPSARVSMDEIESSSIVAAHRNETVNVPLGEILRTGLAKRKRKEIAKRAKRSSAEWSAVARQDHGRTASPAESDAGPPARGGGPSSR